MNELSTAEIRERYERAIKIANGTRWVEDDQDFWLRCVGVLLRRLEKPIP